MDPVVDDLLATAYPTMVELRHDLHAHPELSFRERRTTEVIRARLSELGWTVAPTGLDTGVVATRAGVGDGRRVMLRADIDALPVEEEVDLPYRSTHSGVMHACGHDVHTAALLGVAEVLARLDGAVGPITLVFQPAEEGLGGARALVEDGLFERHPVDVVLGGHVTSLAPTGIVGVRAGVAMSRGEAFEVTLEGSGGHGAMSTREGNVVLALAALLPRLEQTVAHLATDGTPCACSAGVVQAGTANNVVPRRALARGTLRTFTPEQREVAHARFDEILAEVSDDFAITAVVTWAGMTPAVVNDAGVTARVRAMLEDALGPAAVIDLPPTSASDDVAELLERVPGCYLFVGGAPSDRPVGMHHAPDFFVEDASLRFMARSLVAGALGLSRP